MWINIRNYILGEKETPKGEKTFTSFFDWCEIQKIGFDN